MQGKSTSRPAVFLPPDSVEGSLGRACPGGCFVSMQTSCGIDVAIAYTELALFPVEYEVRWSTRVPRVFRSTHLTNREACGGFYYYKNTPVTMPNWLYCFGTDNLSFASMMADGERNFLMGTAVCSVACWNHHRFQYGTGLSHDVRYERFNVFRIRSHTQNV